VAGVVTAWASIGTAVAPGWTWGQNAWLVLSLVGTWGVIVLYTRPSRRSGQEGEPSSLVAALWLGFAVSVLILLVMVRAGYNVDPILLGVFLGAFTSPVIIVPAAVHYLLKNELLRWLLRRHHTRDHAAALLGGLLQAERRRVRAGDEGRKWQDHFVWGAEELAATLQFARISVPPARDANTFRWRRAQAAARAEAVRDWKKRALEPTGTSADVPAFQIRRTLTAVLAERWGDLPVKEDFDPPLGWRDWLGVAAACTIGLVAYYTLGQIEETLRANPGVSDRVPGFIRTVTPFVALFFAWVLVPQPSKRALLEQLAGVKELRDLGGK
jgi:hypothetical protein